MGSTPNAYTTPNSYELAVDVNGGRALFDVNALQDLDGYFATVSHQGVIVWTDEQRFDGPREAREAAAHHVTGQLAWLLS